MAGKQGNNKIIWQQWQLDFLEQNWQRMTAKELSLALELKTTKVREKKYELGYYVMKLEYWTPEQVQFLEENYRHIGDVELAEIFNKKWHKEKGWTKKHIEKKRRHLGLKRSRENINNIFLRNKSSGRFAVGNKKRWETTGVNDNGTIVEWNVTGKMYKIIKIAGKYEHYHRFLYAYVHGDIAPGMNIIFKDRNPLNCVIDNLQCVSDAELALMRSKHNYPEEAVDTLLLIKKLNKKIDEKQNDRP